MKNSNLIRKKGAVAILWCSVFVTFLILAGCDANESPDIDDSSFIKDLEMAYSEQIDDKYVYPIKPGDAIWNSIEISERIEGLQIPEDLLTKISTAGLLETCLEYPYLLDIMFGNNLQHGFDNLLLQFNGFSELLNRPDLVNILIGKYSGLINDVEDVQLLTDIGQGMFSFRHLVLEMIIAQDVIINNLSKKQEKSLFLLSIEHSKIKKNYPNIFSGVNNVPTALLYAKEITKENRVAENMKGKLNELIKAPIFVEQDVMRYLEDYISAKFK